MIPAFTALPLAGWKVRVERKAMQLKVIRDTFTRRSTIGQLFVDGQPECFTLEDTKRPDGVKVFGETCIPEGVYKVIINHSNRFDRDMPLLLGVQGFSGIRIHYGNDANATRGCLLVGETKGTDVIGLSRVSFSALFRKIQAAIAAGEDVTIEITEEK